MKPETNKRFSFAETAAQQPQRQRFSFAQPKRKEIKDFFPATNMVAEATKNMPSVVKPSIGKIAKEIVLPTRQFDTKNWAKTYAESSLKDRAIGLVKGAGEIGFGLSQLSRMGLEKIPGYKKMFGEADQEFLKKIEDSLKPTTPGQAATMRVVDIAGFIPATIGRVSKLGKLSKLDEITNAGVAAKNAEAARLVLKNSGASDDLIKTFKLDTRVAAANTPDAVKNIFKEIVGETPAKKPFSFAEASKQVPPQTTTKAPAVIQDVTKAPVAPLRRTTPFSFADEAAKQIPPTPVATKVDNVATAQARIEPKVPVSQTTLDPRNFKTADEFVAAQGKPVYHGTNQDFEVPKSMKQLRQEGVDIQPANIGGNSPFLHITEDKQLATNYARGRAFTQKGKPIIKEFYVEGKILDKVNGPNVSFYTLERGDQALLDEIKNGGYVGVRFTDKRPGTGANVSTTAVLPEAVKTKSQLEDIWKQAQKTTPVTPTPTPTPTPTKSSVQVVEQRIDDVAETKKWQTAPAVTQKATTQEVAKKYSHTDAEKGFVTQAVNDMDNVPPIKNVTAKARNEAKKPDTLIDLPPETMRGWLQTRLQDSAYRLGLVQKNIAKSGKAISDDSNAYMQREAYIGRASAKIGAFEKKLGMVAGSKNGLLMRMKDDGISLQQLDEYMRAKAAKARNARVASKTEGKVADGGSGIKNKEADAVLTKYANNPTIAQYAKEFRETAIDAKMQVLKDAGIYTDEQIKLITQGEPDYVPFKVEEFSRVQGGGKGFSVQSTGVKGIKGSARTDRTNAVMQSAVDFEEAVIRAEKNKALQSLATLIRENPDKSLWEIKGVTYTPQYNKFGEVLFLRKNPINERTSVEFFENGKAFEITFHDEALAKVFTEEGLTKPIPGLVKINNYLRAVNTVINPEFMITNAIRDLQTAIVTAGGEKGAVVAGKMIKDYPAASKGIWQAVRKESNTGWAKTYNEMIENGGRTGWFDLKDVAETTKEVSARIARYNSTKTSDSLMRAIDSTGKLISDANEVFEMSVRTSAYKQLVDGGMSKVAAANYVKNMTVNFNKRGNWGMTLNSAYLFANAGIQGSARLLMALKNPTVRRITYGVAASSYALNELNMNINPEGYDRLQDFEKERNIIVMLPLDGNKYNLPGISGDPAKGYYLKMPLPYGFNVFKVAGDIAYDVVNKKKTNAEAMVQMLRAIDASFNPLSSGTPTQFVTPTFADPFISHWENKNWFGAPIMPEQPAFAPAVRDSDRYFSGARDISIGTAQFLNRLTGGNEVTSGAVDISPETIDHVIDSIGGGLGNFIGQVIDGTYNTVKGDIPIPNEMPFVRKLIDTPFETGEQSQVFELLEKSATERMSNIEVNRFVKNTTKAIEMGQIDEKTAKRVIKDFVANAARQEAGEVLSLVKEGKIEEAQKIIANAPPSISKELNKLIEDDVEREIKKLKKELNQ